MTKWKYIALIAAISILLLNASMENQSAYISLYQNKIEAFKQEQQSLINQIASVPADSKMDIDGLKNQIESARVKMKAIDFWLRYLNPIAYHKINGPLPVEWETEVFEKFEKPYKRTGAGLSLAELYLNEKNVRKDSLLHLILSSADAIQIFQSDSIVRQLNTDDHFFFANRLFLLNLSA